MEKIKVRSVVSAVFRMDNSEDPEKSCHIEAEVTVGANGVETVYNGVACPGDGGRVTFHKYQSGESGIGFDNVTDIRQRIALMGEIEDFCNTVSQEAADLLGKTRVTV